LAYHDTFFKDDGQWLFQTRRIEVEFMTRLGDVIDRMKPMGFPGTKDENAAQSAEYTWTKVNRDSK
tara:strand:+ start:967 stop:1164 length:198 start_codon:yes stop_codon:yes gene_type:complete